MHICTHVPRDPKMVLALRITEETYEIFKMLPKSKAGRPPSVSTMLGRIIVVAVDSQCEWGMMMQEDFDQMYTPVEKWSKSRFTLCSTITNHRKG